jgi:hypothetical protein
MISLILTLLRTVTATATDPTIDNNPNNKQGWYSAPNYRGTLDIVWPCLLTTFLCCWNAIHPGIPHPKSTWLQRLLDRITCMFLGVISPEMFVWFAYRQRLWAKAEHEELVAIIGRKNWSTAHGFYAYMGGFAIDLISEYPVDDLGCEIGHVHVGSIRRCLEQGRLNPNIWITEQEIQDKGNSDSLGKSLTILQLLWLLLQCSMRLAQHLPLTTLELSTLAYIPCALVIYYLWWDKPYEINTPTYLKLHPEGTFTTNGDMSASDISLRSSKSSLGSTLIDGAAVESRFSSSRIRGTSSSIETSSTNIKVEHLETYARLHTSEASLGNIQAYRTYGIIKQCFASVDAFETYSHMCVTGAISLVMGAVHLSAWNFSFATDYERTAWRICSVLITVNMPLAWFINRILDLSSEYKSWQSGTSNNPITNIQNFKIGLCYVFEASYAVSRLYLAVEVFMALRAAPKDVYRTQEWTNFLPHFG